MPSPHGLLLANLGSPLSPQEEDVRAYLHEFLMDPRILDMPTPLRWLIVRAFILPKRPAQSAHAYASIWWDEGSPLIVLTRRVRDQLAARLAMPVEIAMRYAQPSLRSGLARLLDQVTPGGQIILFPMYPHYAMSTYETLALKALGELEDLVGQPHTPDRAATAWLRKAVVQAQPFSRQVGSYTFTLIPPHYHHPGYLRVLTASIREIWQKGTFDHLLFSFHGVPERHLHKTAPQGSRCLRNGCCQHAVEAHGVCYRHQAFATAHGVARALGLRPGQYSVSFQSRLGRDAWLQPYTVDTLAHLPAKGVKRLAVVTPSFTVDCLETLEEIGMAGRDIFLTAGGEVFQRIPCLNHRDDWMQVMAEMVQGALLCK